MMLHMKCIGHTHPGIYTSAYMGEHSLPKKGMDLERNLSLNPSSINPERLLETHKIFHP